MKKRRKMKKIINVCERVYMCVGESVIDLGIGVYKVYCVKYPYHKEDVGYKRCCPMVGDSEYDIAYRATHCSINCLNSDREDFLNKRGLMLGIEKAIEQYNIGNGVCFVGNGIDSIVPLMCGLFMNSVGLYRGSFNDMLVYMSEFIGDEFVPKRGQLMLFCKEWVLK
jgi:hypothetical protein